MTIAEAAKQLRLHRSRVLFYIKDKRLKAEWRTNELGMGYWWIEPESLQEFAAQQRKPGWPKGKRRRADEEQQP